MSKGCCKKGGRKLSGVEISAIVVGSVSGAAGLAVGAYFLYKHLEKKGKLPWQKGSSDAKPTPAKDGLLQAALSSAQAQALDAKKKLEGQLGDAKTKATAKANEVAADAQAQALDAKKKLEGQFVDAHAQASAEAAEVKAQAESAAKDAQAKGSTLLGELASKAESKANETEAAVKGAVDAQLDAAEAKASSLLGGLMSPRI